MNTDYERLIRLAQENRAESVLKLEDMFTDMVFAGNIDLAKQYLKEVKGVFPKYEAWGCILGVGERV